MKKPFPVRIDEEHIKQLKEYDINIAELFREFVSQMLKNQKCPLCGTQMKKKKHD